ncbi:MAG: tRNA pseudouridine(13) synthase TruD [Anaerolineae bacterium]|nr:tRNA pseudouridine(13) synthase TruD [Anaerolineae bacterium]
MRIKHKPSDFMVEEQIIFPGDEGLYAYYKVEKNDAATTEVRDDMAAKLKVTPSALVFPALKDAAALTIQYASVRKKGPAKIKGPNYTAERVQWGPRALRPRDLEKNCFKIIVRDMEAPDVEKLSAILPRIAQYGIPNYFDDQRFGSLTQDGFIGKEILKRDAERVVHMYLAEPMIGDPQYIREFKKLVESHWGQWGFLLHQAPRPSNFRSVITYLKDHPHEYRKATNLIQDRLLSIYLSAYQSWVWNLIVAEFLVRKASTPYNIDIVGRLFPVLEPGEETASFVNLLVDRPRLTANYQGEFASVAEAVFKDEELEIRDFKARILRRVYLSKGERPIWYIPADLEIADVTDDDDFENRQMTTVSFTLDSGQYATLILKTAAGLSGTPIQVR